MVNLEAYKKTEFTGKIEEIEEMPLRVYLGENVEKFKKGMTKFPNNVNTEEDKELYRETRLDSDVLVVSYSVDVNDKIIKNREYFNIPTITGWGRSKLKSLRDKNSLSFKTDEWIEKPVKVSINKNGYLRLLE